MLVLPFTDVHRWIPDRSPTSIVPLAPTLYTRYAVGGAAGAVIGVALGFVSGLLIGYMLGESIGETRGVYRGMHIK